MPASIVTMCAIEGCPRQSRARGWCPTHYQRWRKYGDPLGLAPPRPPRGCSVEGCPNIHQARGFCGQHYKEWRAEAIPIPCAASGCDRLANARGLCSTHYGRLSNGLPMDQPVIERMTLAGATCLAPGCGARARTKGYCGKHFHRFTRYGDPLAGAPERGSNVGRTCSIAGCQRPSKNLGLCQTHYVTRIAKPLRRARKRQLPTERVDAAVVFARANWTCQICNEPIDPALRRPDVMSASVDHVVALSRGGSHTYDNVQATHLLCNMRKGDRPPA